MVCVAGSVALAGLVAGLAAVMVGIVEIAAFRSVRMYLGVSTLGSGTVLYKVLGIFAIGVLGACAGQLLRIQKMRAGELKSLRSLNEVHSLLLELHTRAEDEPRWLTLNGATRTIVGRLRNEIQADLVTLLLRDPSVEGLEQHWQVAAVEGLRLPPMMVDKRLPGGARQAERQRGVIRVAELRPGQGLDSRSTSGLYAPLWGRSALLGILILERRSDAPFTEYDAEVVDGIARHAGLTIDNTRLFARLRRLGADVERDRIARELHDRIGQSLVGVGLTVDRLAMSLPEEAQEVRRELESVAADVRGVTRQVREKLTDLRTDPASTTELPRALGEFLDRVAARSQIRITFDQNPVRDLTETEAHEVWRIAQEAVLNAERHAGAGHLYIFWGEKNRQRLLIVSDDGKGITGTAPLRRDAYGLIGMRERAEVIGASLILDTGAGKGTTVRLRLKEAKA
jgi:nitrate/nitrite-specific signal transduction histidine kinase